MKKSLCIGMASILIFLCYLGFPGISESKNFSSSLVSCDHNTAIYQVLGGSLFDIAVEVTNNHLMVIGLPSSVLLLDTFSSLDHAHNTAAVQVTEIFPNPFSTKTNVFFDLNPSQVVRSLNYSSDGRQVFTKSQYLASGHHIFVFTKDIIPDKGVYYFVSTSAAQTIMQLLVRK